MNEKYRLVLFSSENQLALYRDIKLPFVPQKGYKILILQEERGTISLVVSEVWWLERLPGLMFVTCHSEHLGTKEDEGGYVVIPFGSLPSGIAEEYLSSPSSKWKRVEDGDDYFTAPRIPL